jgi:hypothetical protein
VQYVVADIARIDRHPSVKAVENQQERTVEEQTGAQHDDVQPDQTYRINPTRLT